ncbi:MAG TPA: GGDEF domain-containing protein [Gammaproteobacteria bacterium]|nr:GGDEF domain-containing protein [Gammaproteobacteria bacterium]
MNGSPSSVAASRLDWFRLRFVDGELERAFRSDYAVRTRMQTRVSLALGLVIYLALGFQDPWFFPLDAGLILLVRLCVSATLLVSVAATFHPQFVRIQQPWVLVQTLVAGAGVVFMISHAGLETANSYFFGVTLVIVWAFNFSGLRFYPALLANVVLITAYGVVFGAWNEPPTRWLATDLSNCVSAAMITGFAGYLIEWQRRVLFDQNRLIDRERESHQQLALFDQLTGLPNRLLFQQRLRESLLHRERRGDRLAVLFLDIDHFKPINDSFGHHAGDRMLSVLASRLKSCLRREDLVARIGGDEFLMLIEDVPQPDDVAAVAEKILEAVIRPLSFRGASDAPEPVQVSASIGIALYPQDGASADELIRAADAAMYTVKAAGRNGYRFYRDASAAAAG